MKVRMWEVPGPPEFRYTKAEVLALLGGIDESTLDRMIADGRFPRGHKVTPQAAPVWSGQVLACWFFLGPLLVSEKAAKAAE